MSWFRRVRLPGDVRARLALRPGERVISYATTRDGGHLVATERALHLPDGRVVGWEQVERVSWEGGWLHFRDATDRSQEYHLRLAEAGTLPQAVRERVTATIWISRYARLRGDRGVRIVGRRPPGSGEVSWSLLFDPGLDPDDPALRAAAERMLGEIREQTGG